MKNLFFLLFLNVSVICNAQSSDSVNVFRHIDKIKELVAKWNNAINSNQTVKLNDLYTSKVEYYGKSISSDECIASKNKWLKANQGYTQQITHLSVYFPEGAENILIAEFDKIYMDKGTKTVTALLNFNLISGQWKITKETDMISEVASVKKLPVQTLSKGKHSFGREFWMDTRGGDIAHDMVPYRFFLELQIGDKISGVYQRYSGMLRSWMEYKIVSGKIENGILQVALKYGSFSEKMNFKIINSKNIMCIDKGEEHYGKILSRYEN